MRKILISALMTLTLPISAQTMTEKEAGAFDILLATPKQARCEIAKLASAQQLAPNNKDTHAIATTTGSNAVRGLESLLEMQMPQATAQRAYTTAGVAAGYAQGLLVATQGNAALFNSTIIQLKEDNC